MKGVIMNVDTNKHQIELETEIPDLKIIAKSFLPFINMDPELANKIIDKPGDYEGEILEKMDVCLIQSSSSLELTMVPPPDLTENSIVNCLFDKTHAHDPFLCNLQIPGGMRGTISASRFKKQPTFPIGTVEKLKALKIDTKNIEFENV